MEVRNGKTDKMPMNRVILMSCGRYNPPTHMHLRMFERARDHLHQKRMYSVVGGIISPVNDRCSNNKDLADSSTRCNLIKLSLKTSDWIRLSSWEVQQNNVKSTRETLQHHQNVLNSFLNNDIDNNVNNEDLEWIPEDIRNSSDRSPVQIKFLCGSDTLKSLLSPSVCSEDDLLQIVEEYGLVIYNKVEKDGDNLDKLIYDSDILAKYMHNIHEVPELIPSRVNSTRIRTALKRGESVKYLIQDTIIDFIYKRAVYESYRMTMNGESLASRTTMDSQQQQQGSAPTKAPARVILMACGSFNPPTHMHLRMFERARDHLHNRGSAIVLGGVISPVNDAYPKKELASGMHRCEMLRLALQDSDWIRLSTWELRQPGWTRTRKCLQHHQQLLSTVVLGQSADSNRNNEDDDNEDLKWIPEGVRNNEAADQTAVQIKLLCGGDLLESFATVGLWADEDIAEIVGQYGLIVITREGSNPEKVIYDSDILSKHSHNIQIVTEHIPNEVSSTRIRRALRRGESVKYLLHDAVIDYVYANGIYGASRPSTIKLELSSNHSSTDFLNADEDKFQHDNAFLTPSPSDVTMLEAASPGYGSDDGPLTSITDELVSDAVLQKNLQNNSSRYSEDTQSSLSIDDTELAREKFFRSIVNDSLSSSLLQERVFDGQIEPPSSARARNELLAFEDTTESELATLCDNTYSEDREEDVLSITYEESSEDLNESSVKNNKDCKEDASSDKANSEDTSSTAKGLDTNESLAFDTLDDSDSQATKFEANFEIDGKYIKSLVNSKKSPKKLDDSESVRSSKEEDESLLPLDESVPKAEEATVADEKIDEERVLSKVTEELAAKDNVIDKKVATEEAPQKATKLFEDDLSYIKRLRLIVNDKPPDGKKQHQGSLDSINQNESNTTTRKVIESMSKKSKSFESIKRNTLSISYQTNEIYSDISVSKAKSDSTSQLVTAQEFDAPTDEFCSACCLASNNEQPSSADVFYTLRSNCSSPGDEDSTECDICSSCNLRDSNEALDCRTIATAHSLSEPTEICEICGEPATSTDEALTDTPTAVINSRPMPLSLPKAKSTIEISRGTYRMSTMDDDRFEIDNCGLQDCKLRASLNICNKPEPLYVNVMPRHNQLSSIGIDSRKSSRPRYDHPQVVEPECQPRVCGLSSQELRYVGPKDEVAMSRSVSISGTKRLSRKGSYAKKSTTDRSQEKRRYSSADNLQNRMSFRSTGEKLSKSRESKFMISADSIRPTRISRSRSLRRSTDNVVGRFDSSGDNLDSLEETTADTDENGTSNGDATSTATVTRNSRVKIRDSDTIKMILTKHGIKIISQKETVL